MSITEVAIKRPLLITVIFVTLILFGFISYSKLDLNLLPKFESNTITVSTVYIGAGADEVQSTVSKPIEDAVSAIEGVDRISSSSQEGISAVVIQLKAGISSVLAQRDAERRIEQIKNSLPEDADDPIVRRFSTDEFPILRLTASGDLGPTELYDLVDRNIQPTLANVAGVGQVNIIGGNQREIRVDLDMDKLRAYGLSAAQVSNAITSGNRSFPAGSVETSASRIAIRFDSKATRTDDLRNYVVRQDPNGGRILLRDIATVTDASAEPTTINRSNGVPGIGLEIIKQSDANAVKVSQGVKKALEDLGVTYASNKLEFDIAMDQSIYTLASANAVTEDLILAVFIVAIVMLLFLHSLRSSMFVLVALPSTMIPTFICMLAFGFSLNLMTLMALSLVVGILVDDSIVVLENIYRHMEMGKSKREAALEGRNEIGFTAIAITLVDVVVFIPLALSGGLIGNILREFSLVVVFSTLLSLVVSFTLTPLMASRWGKITVLDKGTLWGRFNLAFEHYIDGLKDRYARNLRWALTHKRWVIIGVIVLLFGSFALVPAGFIGTAFFNNGDRGEIAVQVELDGSASLRRTDEVVSRMERMIMAHPEVVKAFSNVGTQTGNIGGGGSSGNIAEINVKLVEAAERKMSSEQFGTALKGELTRIPGVKVAVRPVGITGRAEAAIQIAVKGTDMDSIWKAANMVKALVRATPGTDDVEFSTRTPRTEIDIDLDRARMAALGLDATQVGSAIQLAFRGNDRNKFTENGEEYDINVILDKGDRRSVADVRKLSVVNAKGRPIALEQFAEVHERMGQSVLERTDRMNSIKVNATSVGRPTGTIVQEIQGKMKKAHLPDGITVKYLGEAERQKDAFGSLGFAMLLGIILVYLVMVALYESVVYPFVVLFAIPLALIGALMALALSMQPLSIFAIVGLIMLMGLVAKNGILIVDFTNQLKERGMPVMEALVEAGRERLRPILMTTLAMIFGMMPIALATGSGSEVKKGMAWVIIGGLTSSLVLTLFVVPVVYRIIEGWRVRVNRKFGRVEEPVVAPIAIEGQH